MFGSLSPVFAIDYDQEQAQRDSQQSIHDQQHQQLVSINTTTTNTMPSTLRVNRMSQMGLANRPAL